MIFLKYLKIAQKVLFEFAEKICIFSSKIKKKQKNLRNLILRLFKNYYIANSVF